MTVALSVSWFVFKSLRRKPEAPKVMEQLLSIVKKWLEDILGGGENRNIDTSALHLDSLYHKLGIQKCFHCFQSAHRSNQWPNCRQAQFLDGGKECEDEDHEEQPFTENEVENISVDEGEMFYCVMKNVLLSSYVSKTRLFRMWSTIEGKVCELIIDGRCTEKIISIVVNTLHLKTTKHPNPYKISWIKKYVDVIVTNLCSVTFSIGKKSLC